MILVVIGVLGIVIPLLIAIFYYAGEMLVVSSTPDKIANNYQLFVKTKSLYMLAGVYLVEAIIVLLIAIIYIVKIYIF